MLFDAAKEGADAVLSLTQTVVTVVTTIIVTAWTTILALAKGKAPLQAASAPVEQKRASNSEQLQSTIMDLRKQVRESEQRLEDRLRLLGDEIRGDLARSGARVDGHSASLAAVARNLTSLSATVTGIQAQLNEHERGAEALVVGVNQRLRSLYEAGVGKWQEPLSLHDGGLKFEGVVELGGQK